jgi:hypothetical protein
MSDEERNLNSSAFAQKGVVHSRMKVSEKGAVSIYGHGALPVTMVEAIGYVGRHSRVHCRQRSAVEDEGLKSVSPCCHSGALLTVIPGSKVASTIEPVV